MLRSFDQTTFQSLLGTYLQTTMAPLQPLTCPIDRFSSQLSVSLLLIVILLLEASQALMAV